MSILTARVSVALISVAFFVPHLAASTTPRASAKDAERTTPMATNWPQYRGPQANGISPERGFDATWGENEPAVLWKVPLGSGFSGLSIVDDRLYTMFGKDGKEYLGAFAAGDGATLWRLPIGPERGDQFGDGPRSTPVIADGTVYAVGAYGVIVAADTATGAERWRVDLRRRFKARVPTWGVSAEVAVHGEVLIHNAGGPDHAVVALDRSDGSLVWRAGDDVPGYSQPLVTTLGGRLQAIIFSGTQLIAVDPADGTLLWQEPWKTSYDVNAATPIALAPDRLFISSGYDTGAAMLRVQPNDGAWQVERVWSSPSMKNQFSTSILKDGFIYGFDNKILRCLDAEDGSEQWATRGFGHGSLVWADEKLIILGDRGTLAIADATPEGFRELARTQPLEGKHWTVPTLSGGRLYIRNEHHLACLDVSG